MWKQLNGIFKRLIYNIHIPLSKCNICVVTDFLFTWFFFHFIQFVVIRGTHLQLVIRFNRCVHWTASTYYLNIVFFALRPHSRQWQCEFPQQFVSPLFFSYVENKWWFPSLLLRRLLSIFALSVCACVCICVCMCQHTVECVCSTNVCCTVYMCWKVQDFHGKIQAFHALIMGSM